VTRRRDREQRPARRAIPLEPRRRLLVVCEGVLTEPGYFRGLLKHVKNPLVEIFIPQDRGERRRLVEIAKEQARIAEIEARNSGDRFLAFDEVWCVFDRDQHERFDEAVNMAQGNDFRLAVSVPCFELWLLLHLRDSPGMSDRKDLGRMLKERLPAFDKAVVFGDFVSGLEAARGRARRLEEAAQADGEPFRNPTTGVHRLVASIVDRDRPAS
jgi:hypothetical protein